jgi:tRNA threonylcarbamoyladenosine biosynthesis protein TsaB
VIVLGIETATARLSAALAGPDGVMAAYVAPEDRRHTEQLAPAIEDLCRISGIRLSDLAAVTVDVGPGLFTGLRVGIATAAALASALDIPAVGMTSTDVLAEPHHRRGRSVVAVVDVRRGELAWARYGPDGGTPEIGPALITAEELITRLTGTGEVLVVGDGADRCGDALGVLPGIYVVAEAGQPEAGQPEAGHPDAGHPSAEVLAVLARRRLLSGEAVVGDLTPCYLRGADVRIGWAPAAVSS